MYQLEEGQLRQMMSTAAELGAKHALIAAGIDKTEISQAESYRRFSRKSVDGWIQKGIIKPIKRGSSIKLNLAQLESLSMTNLLLHKHLHIPSKT